MTPRHADVAYVLEGIAGVRGVFVVNTATHDFAVAVEQGGGTLAEVHYALLRVLSYEDVQRVHVFHTDAPPFVQGARALALTEMDRAAARARVPYLAPRPRIVAYPSQRPHLRVLIVSDDRTLKPLVRDSLDLYAYVRDAADHVEAARLATQFDLILCDASRAFGLHGLLARLSLERADHVMVVAEPHDAEAAERRLLGKERLLVKPVTGDALRQRVLRRPALTMAVAGLAIARMPPPPSEVMRVLAVTDDASLEVAVRAALEGRWLVYAQHDQVAAAVARNFDFDAHIILCEARYFHELPPHLQDGAVVIVPRAVTPAEDLPTHVRTLQRPFEPVAVRTLFEVPAAATADEVGPRTPSVTEPFTAVLLDVPDEVAEALRRILPIDSRHLSRPDALLSPFHVAFVSAKAALAEESVLARGDERVVVLAPTRDVAWVRHSLARDGHAKARVLALPIDDALLAREVYRDHPQLAARVAIAESDPFPSKPARRERMRVLIVDDDITTQMLRAAATPTDNVDITLATTAMQSLEHLVSASVTLLVVSASMRSDGGEPLYRVLWRLTPELKTRTVLITDPDFAPPSSGVSADHSRRIVSRPLTTQVVGKIVELNRR